MKYIEDEAFSNCINLESIEIPDGIEVIEKNTFCYCSNLKKVKLPNSLKKIEEAAFYACEELSSIELKDEVSYIGEEAFSGCSKLRWIKLSSNLKEIGDFCFNECKSLKSIVIPKKVALIGKEAFLACVNLEMVIFEDRDSSKLKKINSGTFADCTHLEIIKLPDSIEEIGNHAFSDCERLKKIILPNSLNELGEKVFYKCISLSAITIPNGVSTISQGCFCYCSNLTEVNLHDNIKTIETSAFQYDYRLEKIQLPNNLETIYYNAFDNTRVKEFIIPPKVRAIYRYALPSGTKKITMYHDVIINKHSFFNTNLNLINRKTKEVINIKLSDLDGYRLVDDGDNVIKVNNGTSIGFFSCSNKWVNCMWEEYTIKEVGSVSRFVHTNSIRKLYEWKRRKFMPHKSVIKNMPFEEIDKFYANKNPRKWKELLDKSKITSDEEISGFFKLCYVLGLFEKSGKVSDKAYEFIMKYILKNEKKNTYHIRFEEMIISDKGFNKEFAELVFKYYPKEKTRFLVKRINFREKRDYFSAVYNGFEEIKKIYSSKVVKTTTKREMLTPELCMTYMSGTYYNNVLKGNEEFARNIGLYGYSQNDFDYAQELFEIGKSIPSDEITLHVKNDDTNKLITYELLDKDNPLGVILGNITNCCQTLNGTARRCVEYGLSKRNSKFMVFRYKNEIIGQSWVWYDEDTKRICLDNIELTNFKYNKVKQVVIQAALLECLKRMTKGFVNEMESRNLEVSSVTVGNGYNELNFILALHYQKIIDQPKLSDYTGYSDASNQYVLYNRKVVN